jgi:sec-independent protein translocase protein TatC
MSEADDRKMPLLEHLIELRNRLLWCVVAIGVSFGVCFYFAEPIYAILVQPLKNVGQDKLVYIDVFEAFFVQVKVAFFASMMVSFPVLATQIWRFVAPGLYRNEKRAFLPFLMMTPLLFGLGASLAYFGAMPVALKFLLSYQGDIGGVTQEALPGVGSYLDFSTKFIFGFGVAFQLPVVLMLLERAGIVTREQLKNGRRYAIVGSFAVAAVLTPPDVVSQLLLAIPLCLLYEFALLAILFTQRRRKKAVGVADAVAEDATAT